jgi:hypothetical protein
MLTLVARHHKLLLECLMLKIYFALYEIESCPCRRLHQANQGSVEAVIRTDDRIVKV